MKRLGIFVFYDQDGIADKSTEYLLDSLLEILERIIIVINGEITNESYQIMTHYSKDIICRANEGYDGGAYQDIFQNYLNCEKKQQKPCKWQKIMVILPQLIF